MMFSMDSDRTVLWDTASYHS